MRIKILINSVTQMKKCNLYVFCLIFYITIIIKHLIFFGQFLRNFDIPMNMLLIKSIQFCAFN